MELLQELKNVNTASGEFATGILEDSLSREAQVVFALRLVRLTERIRDRSESTAGMIVEGVVVGDHDGCSPGPGVDTSSPGHE